MKQSFDNIHAKLMPSRLLCALRSLVAIFMGLTLSGAIAQQYPTKAVRIIASEPGGSTDLVARTIGQKLSEQWRQPVVVENRGGASGIIGVGLAAKAANDGYTLLIGHTGTLAINPFIFKSLPYDPVRDFAPVTLVLATPLIVVVNPALPAASLADLIALARAKPKTVAYGSSGSGIASHLASELFSHMAKVGTLHVPFRGTAPAITAVVSGEVAFMFTAQTTTMPLIKAGRLRAIAVTGASRSTVIPDLPTVSESGLPGFEVVNWQGVLAPAGTPRNIIAKVHDDIVASLALPDARSRLTTGGSEVVGNSPEQFAALIKSEIAKWGSVVKSAGIKAE